MVTRCRFCGGDTALECVTAETWWRGTLALVENVPAQVCQTCGEQYFSAATWRALEQRRERTPESRRTVQVPVYSFAEAG